MQTDIILESRQECRRIVIDTKFTEILTNTAHRERVLKSGYLYQVYAYLRSQEGEEGGLADSAEGWLLHPAVGADVDETIRVQGHDIRFVTINLMLPAASCLTRSGVCLSPEGKAARASFKTPRGRRL